MRQRVGPKKIEKYRRDTNLPICTALVRGGTNHRVDLCLEGGKIVYYWPKTGEKCTTDAMWDYEGWVNENTS